VVGVNARDLSTFELDRDLFGTLADSIPSGVIRIAESAVLEPADVTHYRAAGADVVLIGEALVRGEDPVATLHEFLAAGS
jgi:indole-3-glycerol phosphate synthase